MEAQYRLEGYNELMKSRGVWTFLCSSFMGLSGFVLTTFVDLFPFYVPFCILLASAPSPKCWVSDFGVLFPFGKNALQPQACSTPYYPAV